jgi:hypothetical protein
MYLYLAPQGGFNDILARIQYEIEYCKRNNRILLVDTTKGCYKINFSDFFYLMNIPIKVITDINVIRKIIADTSLTIYPHSIIDRKLDNWNFIWNPSGIYTLNQTLLTLPTDVCIDNIIIHSRCGGGNTISLFKNLFFNQRVIHHVKNEFIKLPKKYLCIQIRNTDYKCDYESLYESNKELIHSYKTIYVATDDKASIDFFKLKKLNVINFTEFPEICEHNLHDSAMSSDTKIKNLICDIYIIAMADELLSNSKGGFINLVRNIRNDMSTIDNKFN